MFLFYNHDKQTEKNENYWKGILFEKLLGKYLIENGYTVNIRVKKNSLEYDLEGNDKTTNLNIIGEAKAYQASISGQTLSAFAGKLLGLGILEKKVHGLFLSTSPLTPDAKDFYNTIKPYGITCYTGEDLFDRIIDALKMPTKQQVFPKTKEIGYKPLLDFILTTNFGYRKLVIATNMQSMTPSCFLVFDNNLNLVNDEIALRDYQNIKELRGLKYICGNERPRTNTTYREIQQGLIIGKDWTDYRLPAAPEYFVGREELISQIINYITSNQSESRVIQIKSRSGVGKSSLLSLLSEKLSEHFCDIELHDARDIKSTVDVFSVIGRFTKSNMIPKDFSEVEHQLKEMNKDDKKYIFMVDQFESTFFHPDIFTAYESMAKMLCSINKNIYFCLARKNDQLTTYDDSLVTLNQLNSLSKNYELKDFTKEEAKDLLDKINFHVSKKISNEVLSYILEFAQGFPWLVKRTMSHIIKLTNNVSQKQLLDTGLMLDDLFNEELDGLEEIEKEYLTRICAKLPADIQQLQIFFEEDSFLPKMLDKFTQVRLLRLTGTTYDTYNDVFKEYLVYQKLPEFKHRHIFRHHPNATMKFFVKIINRNKFTISQLSKTMKTSEKSLANYIKECRNLGLLKKENDYWTIPKNIKDMYTEGHLGMHIRRQVSNNELVSTLIKLLNSNSLSFEDFTKVIKENSLYVEAVDSTWNLYANTLIAWMIATKIVERNKNSNISLDVSDKSNIGEFLGNMINSYGQRGLSASRDTFLPSTSWKYYESMFVKYRQGERSFTGEEKKAFIDFKSSDMITVLENSNSIDIFKKTITENYLNTPEYSKIWKAARENSNILTPVAELVKVEMTPSTLQWRAKRIINCGKALSIIEDRRYSCYSGKKSDST